MTDSAENATLLPTCLPAAERGGPLVAAAGESHYQAALIEVCGRSEGEAVRFECEALLVPDFNNPHDENAIRVEIAKCTVAYLSREDAVAYRPVLIALREAGFVATCRALIAGRDRRDLAMRTLNLGVFLDIAEAETCRHTLFGKRR